MVSNIRTIDHTDEAWSYYKNNLKNYIFKWDDKDKNGYAQYGIAIIEAQRSPIKNYIGPEFVNIGERNKDHYAELVTVGDFASNDMNFIDYANGRNDNNKLN